MRRALIVGIDNYPSNPLAGCVADAESMAQLLANHEDGQPNLQCRVLVSPPDRVTRRELRNDLEHLFSHEADIALFYFSGHGINVNNQGGFLVTQDASSYDLGVSMLDVLNFANTSPVHEAVIILDCCDSGAFGQIPAVGEDKIILRDGVSILTSSGPRESSVETNGRGVFTKLVCDALSGGASDVRGEVNAASIYSYCDQTLGAWDQRPRFKANVSRLTELRLCKPQVELPTLRLLTQYFPTSDHEYGLDPSYEPDKRNLPPGSVLNEEHEIIFSRLQKYRAARLLVPVGEDHMYYAAANSKSCRLTPLGQFYWHLVKTNRI